MDYVHFEYDQLPIITIRYTSKEPTEEEFDTYLAELDKMYMGYKDFYLVLDATQSKYLSSKLRIKQGKWLEKNKEAIAKSCNKQYYVVNSMMIKIVMNAILLISKPAVPYMVCKTEDEALNEISELTGATV